MIKLYSHQKEALEKLESGNVLVGDVGSGKSLTAIYWYYEKVCNNMKDQKPLYIITTAKKRDDFEWEKELAPFLLTPYPEVQHYQNAPVVIDSWNNIKKYQNVYGAVFIFDEQRLVGSGAWVKAFLKIANKNKWILLTATPGDKPVDLMPVLIANGFYRNKTDFYETHVEVNRYCGYPKITGYHNQGLFIRNKNRVIVRMNFKKPTEQIHKTIKIPYDEKKTKEVIRSRWDPYKNEPIAQASSLCYILRRITNENPERIAEVWRLHQQHPRIIIFYNFDYELDILRQMCEEFGYEYAEWNGHKHDKVPTSDRWLYLVQYTAGNEGWNCITCSTIIFFSNSYSYKVMTQAAGRIDRMNTPYKKLYYYHLTSDSVIDKSIEMALRKKKKFNEKMFEAALI